LVENILSIDVEEVFHGEYTRQYKGQNPTYRTPYNIPRIIEMLKDHGVKATFFIVGEIAEKYPEVVKMVREEGHEVAFHGWTHEPLWKLTSERFREEIKAFKKLHPDCIGFRAPSFSLNNKTKWVLKILQEEGFKYDSSIFPTWTPLYGMYNAPAHPYYPSMVDITKMDNDGLIMEFPLAVYKLFKLKVPIAGGFWLRLWSLDLIEKGIRKINGKGFPAVTYIHNWELDPETPRLKLSFYKTFVTYYCTDKTEKLFRSLLRKFKFTNFADYMVSNRVIRKCD